MADTMERRRRRPAVYSSCNLCRKRKIKCNREYPCSNCLRHKIVNCVYQKDTSRASIPNRAPRLAPTPQLNFDKSGDQSWLPDETEHGTPTSQKNPPVLSTDSPNVTPVVGHTSPAIAQAVQDVESMKRKIKALEDQLEKACMNPSPPERSSVSVMSRIGPNFYVRHDKADAQGVMSRSVMHKTRLFGQSHWINGISLFRDILGVMEPHLNKNGPKPCSSMYKCKTLARTIKSRRAPAWPAHASTELPTRDVADKLVDCYFETFESIYRVLHIPTFRRDYEEVWVPGTNPDPAFLVQLKLVFAIGATTYDAVFSLRASATRWFYEAQTWFSEPEYKSRLNISSFQIELLLIFARECVGIGANLTWITVGALLRTAIYMGLHRDPSYLPKSSILAAEMRRRLWNSALEIALQTSMQSGGPPMISPSDFDTLPPRNFNDDDLISESQAQEPQSAGQFTQSSTAIALRETFPIRLAIAQYLNDFDSTTGGSYETMRLDAELKAAYKKLAMTFQAFNSNSTYKPSTFQTHAVDLIIRRFMSAIHIPFFASPGFGHEDKDGDVRRNAYAHAYSRGIVVECSMRIWGIIWPCGGEWEHEAEKHILARLVANSSGFFRLVAMQAGFLIAADLKCSVLENVGLGIVGVMGGLGSEAPSIGAGVVLRPDLLRVLEDWKAWSLKCIASGETNVKGYHLSSVLTAHIDGLTKGMGGKDSEMADLLLKTGEEADARCLTVLEEMERESNTDGGLMVGRNGSSGSNMAGNSELLGSWDFLLSDPFNFEFRDDMAGMEVDMGIGMGWIGGTTMNDNALW